ncbi:MAG: aminodeoxychorismate synthase component I [Anaerolineales bacterium]
MIETNEVLLKSNHNWLHYSRPFKVVQTERIQEVREALREVESLVNANGWHAAGFIAYEAAPAFDSALHVLSSSDFPLLWFGLYAEPRIIQLPKPGENSAILNWQAGTERESYNTAIEKIKDAIASGKTYQVNYTMRLKTDFPEDDWNFFLQLAKNQNKYAAYINLGRHIICSASPELFFELNGETVTSRPMKGTVKRGRTTREDKEQMDWLRHSVKNRAENVMIVDMNRNDLGRIAEIGSVHVPELFTVEKYPTLFQMTSTVQAKTRASITEIFTALFPCASITGAPKVSTMKIISELETAPRKIYTGSIGTISPNRKAQFNVAIRTVLIDKEKKQAEYGVGGGIVWDSTSAGEYSEALLKARVLTERPQAFSLFETILCTSQDSPFLAGKHIERMADSAEYFDFPFSKKKLEDLLIQIARGITSPKRVKVLLNCSGELSAEAKDFHSAKNVFKVCLAKHPIDSNNIFLYHKTTRREIFPVSENHYDDVLLFNERDELTEFTLGNLVVETAGKFFTPPVSCGLLAGTFRAHLLEINKIKERVIRKDELQNYSSVFLVNSLRRWVKVELQKEPVL